jgi:hypothetical protein
LHLSLILFLYMPIESCIPASPSLRFLTFQHGIPLSNLLDTGQ